MNHRVKNTLATIQAIALHTFRNGSEGNAPKWFEGRLLALSRTHDVLTRKGWEGANFKEIVQDVIAPHFAQTVNRFSLDGPGVHLPPKLALSLAIVLHELRTNAAKYGALSNGVGTIIIAWSATSERPEQRGLRFLSEERDGPEVDQPQVRGFGSRVIERTLPREHNAKVNLDYLKSGVHCEIKVDLS